MAFSSTHTINVSLINDSYVITGVSPATVASVKKEQAISLNTPLAASSDIKVSLENGRYVMRGASSDLVKYMKKLGH